MNREEVLRIVSAARDAEEQINLRGADLQGADLHGVDLRGADLHSVGLRGANLTWASLCDADLCNADLRNADMRWANLRRASLWGADLRRANLCDADLRNADLRWADLRWADLRDANLSRALWHGLLINELPSGQLILTPTLDGWEMRVGCWHGTPDSLRTLISKDEGWPEAEGEEIIRRRPYLEAALALCEVHMRDHAYVIDELKERWGEK